MKIITAHIKIKYVICFFVFIILICTLMLLVNSQKSSGENLTEMYVSEIETEGVSEPPSNSAAENTMRDKDGNPYTPSSNITVYLTFDDGPSKNTPELLNILENYGIGATFFVINGKYNGYLKDIAESKSALALHSYSHKYPEIYTSEKAFLDDLDKIHNLVLAETGVDTRVIRFPGGSSNTISRKYCKGLMTNLVRDVEEKGYVYFDWNCDNGDAGGNETAAEYQIKKASKYPQNAENIVILMHDINVCGVKSEALCGIIDYYQELGADFGVITENSPRVCHKINN